MIIAHVSSAPISEALKNNVWNLTAKLKPTKNTVWKHTVKLKNTVRNPTVKLVDMCVKKLSRTATVVQSCQDQKTYIKNLNSQSAAGPQLVYLEIQHARILAGISFMPPFYLQKVLHNTHSCAATIIPLNFTLLAL